MNLLHETLKDIKDSGHTPEDIIFIGSEESGHTCTWEEFQVLANHDYDAGFGASEVATDLKIVFSDGTTMYRSEYDGSEWWEYSKPFVTPENKKPIKNLFANQVGWESLDEIHSLPGEAYEAA